jgi:hypothetical protein
LSLPCAAKIVNGEKLPVWHRAHLNCSEGMGPSLTWASRRAIKENLELSETIMEINELRMALRNSERISFFGGFLEIAE